jgi:hypothetical protein
MLVQVTVVLTASVYGCHDFDQVPSLFQAGTYPLWFITPGWAWYGFVKPEIQSIALM